MERPGRLPAHFGLPDTAEVRADLGRLGVQATVLASLSRAGDPHLAVRQLVALVDAAGAADGQRAAAALVAALNTEPALRGRLIGLMGASEPLGSHLVQHPALWQRLHVDDPIAEVHSECGQELRAAVRDADGHVLPPTAAAEQLRTAYRTLLAMVAACDVAPPVDPELPIVDVSSVGATLALIADGVLRAALDVAEAAHPHPGTRMAVIAMGKCGANELNYVSDVDVQFVIGHDTEADPESHHAATERARTLMAVCSRAAWEVDAALRPEGKAGPLVRSLDGYRSYYRDWAKTWEFQALLKARFSVGDAAIGSEYLDLVSEQVWSAAGRPGFVSEVQQMRRRVRESVPVQHRDHELKLSAGGLRDVEFAVQLLQLVHGRVDETLRVRGTIEALAALTAGGYIGRDDGAELTQSYGTLRRIEHVAQLRHFRRTHSLPPAPADRDALARSLGWTAAAGATTLDAELARCSSVVRRLHEKLFYQPLLVAVAAVPTEEMRLSREAAAARLAALDFHAPDAALRHIAALTDGVSRRAAIQRTLLPVLLGVFSEAPDPDAALLRYRTVSDALADTHWYLRLLRDEGQVAQRLARLLGLSRLLADLLPRAPEVLRLLADDAALAGSHHTGADTPIPPAAGTALMARAARAQRADAVAAAARSARRHEMARVVAAELLGLSDASEVMRALTGVADAALSAVLSAAHRQIARERGDDTLAATVSIIAMGRLGGSEMGYASDADVLFVATPNPEAPEEQAIADATAVAELAGALLGRASPDPPLIVDADLRPEGRSGPLVRTVDSYRRYWERNVEPWHRQALLRARLLSDDDASREFLAVIDPLRYPAGGLSAADTREIRRLKARMDTERLPRGADRTLHTKLGRGGLADVEWAIQLVQLRHGHKHPELRQTSTLAAIDAAVAAGLLDAEDGATLTAGWQAASRARDAIMIVTGRPVDEIPADGRELAAIAQVCGFDADLDPGAFVDDYRRATRRARAVVERIFEADTP